MDSDAPLPSFVAVVVAAGKGTRAGQAVPKQFASWRGKPLVRHSVERLLVAGASQVIVVIPDGMLDQAHEALAGIDKLTFAIGGATRQVSVMQGLLAVAGADVERVLIHDAARPLVPRAVIARLLAALETHPGAIPVLPVVDSLALAKGDTMAGSADRDALRRVQTPQAFHFDAIMAAHKASAGDPTAGDDAQVLVANGGSVALVAGDEALAKITIAEDFMVRHPLVRTGTGYDVHRLAEGEELWLGGVKIEHDRGLAGHSDADVALHAIVDALLGAVGAGDIGQHFPPSDPQWRGAASDRFLAHAAKRVAEVGYQIGNIDLTIICEEPRIGPHREPIKARIAGILGVSPDLVNVKATTTERLGFTGRAEGIAAQAVATVYRDAS